jgi:ABC-2 type transport system ATP-binding protein
LTDEFGRAVRSKDVMTQATIEAEGLQKHFGETHALRGVDFAVPEGTILGLLGPNGAGKTTAVRILTTLTKPDAGHAVVAGIDVLHHPAEARRRIGVAGQTASLDELLTGRENLAMVGRLYHLPGGEATRRADELLHRFDLDDAADRPTKTYSGGMRRRLDLAAALVARPPVLFLDEPTTGLDPRSRLSMWELIAELAQGGSTVLMTTQYLEEADRLADDIVVIDHGRVIARGTPTELKQRIGGERLVVTVAEGQSLERTASVLAAISEEQPHVDEPASSVSVPVADHTGVLTRVIRQLDAAGIEVDDAGFRTPTLDEVFLNLTGRPADEVPSQEVAS